MEVNLKKLNIAVVGGGLGGLGVTNLLLKAGHTVRVYEQAPQFSEVGAGISLPPNAARVVDSMGLKDVLKTASNIPDRGRIYNGKTGKVIKYTPFGDTVFKHFGEYYYQLHRSDFVDLLVNGIKRFDENALQIDHKFSSYEQNENSVTLKFTNQPNQTADLLIGADGIRSTIRSQICGTEDPEFTGYVAWGAVIPMERLPNWYKTTVSNVWIGKGRNMTFYPVRHGKFLNVAMFASDQEWSSEGWNIPANISDIKAAFEGYHERVQTVIDAIQADMVFKWGLFGRPPINNWQDKKVILMGDAAHPMLPFLGQGASMAFEDAGTLANAISTQPTIEEAFSFYLKHREERANWVLNESIQAGERFVAENPNGDTFGKDGAMKMQKLFGYKSPEFV